MAETITLEFLSKQLDRVIVGLREIRDEIRLTREIILSCTAKVNAAHELAREIVSLSDNTPA